MRTKAVALVAALFVVTAELLRACGPLLDGVAGVVGIPPAAAVAIGLFILPGALLVTLRRASLPGMIVFLFLVRVTAQFAPNVAIVGAGAVLGLVALALAVQRAADAPTAGMGLLAGGVLDLAIRSVTMTWDPIWTGLWGLPMVSLVILALWMSLAVKAPTQATLGRTWAVGAYLGLWTTTIGNPAFVASQSGLALQLSIVVIMAGAVVGFELVRRASLLPLMGLLALVALPAGVWLAWWRGDSVSLAGVVLVQLAAAVAVTRAVAMPGRVGSTLLGLVWVVPVLLFQLHYEGPLPLDNRLIVVAVAVVVGLAGAGRRVPVASAAARIDPPQPGIIEVVRPRLAELVQPVTVALALLLLIPLGFLMVRQEAQAAQPTGAMLRLLSWNVKYGRDDASGAVNPSQIAAAVRDAEADVVVLQEVSRGWAIGGGLDLASYLGRELDMEFHWAPAADRQFGNLLLVPRGTEVGFSHATLPFGQGPMWRSYLRARVGGFDIVATHLTHHKKNTPTRLAQIETILREKPDIVVGDLNFWPTWDERRAFAAAGYVSAQDFLGQGAKFTSPTSTPTNRVDWLFGSAQIRFLGFGVRDHIKASDHFPIVGVISR
ncbi:endonuclease/exonuclease/phosphatase family protein [Allorhizocola rhizosphaerae]|uniref:endonuclease/exonuclease/phosphatase family protein n=1 Tax=Allorhizocola rhizosphaerae TaxID=1872709 RepID=UPI000E3C9384|nr:endonuclease/exonuclease/phosphatase family protein [Allorhizocola rhizosphaerae]